jgi:ABC-type sugar transport system substrate-binding protein
MKNTLYVLSIMLVLSMLLGACAPAAAPAPAPAAPAAAATSAPAAAPAKAASGKGVIAYSQSGMENEWRAMNTKEMEKAVKAAGYDFVWTNANGDAAKQLADVESLLAQKPALLVIAPLEYEALAPVPGMANKAGIPLIVVDRALKGDPGKDNYLALLTTDFVDTGRQVGKNVVDVLTKKNGAPKGKLLHVMGTKGASPVIDEEKGILEVLKAYPDIQIVTTCDGQYSREPGRKCTEDLLQAYPKGSIDGIIFDSDDMAVGGMQAIKAAGRDDLKGYLWGKDGIVDGLQAMIDGWLTFSVQTPPFFGASTMKVWQNYLDKKPLGDPVQYVPKETFNTDTPEHIQRLKDRINELKDMGVGCC